MPRGATRALEVIHGHRDLGTQGMRQRVAAAALTLGCFPPESLRCVEHFACHKKEHS